MGKMDWQRFKEGLAKDFTVGANAFNNSNIGRASSAAFASAAPMLSSGNTTTLGNIGIAAGGALSTINPLLGIAVTGLGVLGNEAFGSNVNDAAYTDYKDRLVDYSRMGLNAEDNTQLLNQINASSRSFNINKSDLGTEGWFNRDVTNRYNNLVSDLEVANASRASQIDNAVSNVNKRNKMRVEANYAALGGPLSKLDPLLKKKFPDEPSIQQQMEYRLLEESVPGMPAVYPYDFESRTKAQRAINAERDRRDFEKRMQERDARKQRVLEKLDEFDNKYLGNRFIGRYDRGLNKGDFYAHAFGGPIFGYASDGAIGYDMMRDKINLEYAKALGKQTSESTAALNSFDKGGRLFSTDFDLGLSFINNGDTHENNPYGGVPMGIAPDGTPNVVEEGEILFKDYVFSNRLKVPKAVRNKYKLRKPESFADAMAEYIKKNGIDDRENDPIAQRGLMAFASDLALAQELVRAKKDNGSMNKYATGGPYIGYNRDIDPVPMETEGSDYMTALHWLARPENVSYLRQLQSDITGGLYDDANGPNKINGVKINDSNWWRLATDGKVGPVHNAFMKWANENRNLWGAPVAETPAIDPGATAAAAKAAANEAAMERAIAAVRPIQPGDGSLLEDPALATRSTTGSTEDAARDRTIPYGIFGYGPRMAGLFANAAGLAYNLMDPYRPDVIDEVTPFTPISGTPIGQYVPELHLDTNYAANQAAQQAAATRSAIMESTSPSRNAALLAADYNAQNVYGTLLRDAQLADYESKLKARAFNREPDKYNSQLDVDVAKFNAAQREANENSRMRQKQYNIANYDMHKRGKDQAIGANITSLANWLTDFGKERSNLAMVGALRDSGALNSNEAMDLLYAYLSGSKTKRRA